LPTINGVKPVSPEQEELIHRLVYFQNEYEQPSEEDLKRITVRVPEFSKSFRVTLLRDEVL
jgi:hypothetical protein